MEAQSSKYSSYPSGSGKHKRFSYVQQLATRHAHSYPAPCTSQHQKRCFTTEGTAGRPVSPMEELPEVYTVVAILQHDRLVAVHTSIESGNKTTASTGSGKELATEEDDDEWHMSEFSRGGLKGLASGSELTRRASRRATAHA